MDPAERRGPGSAPSGGIGGSGGGSARTTFANFPETQEPNETSEADRVVALIVDAKRTLSTVNRLHRLVLLVWIPLGLFCYSPGSERRWQGKSFGIVPAADLFQNLWGVCLLMLVALRNDFPVNLIGIVCSAFFFGMVVGTHSTFSLVCAGDRDALSVW